MISELAFKQLGRHKSRTFLTIFGVAIGILLFTAINSFTEGINSTMNNELSYLSGLVTVTGTGVTFQTFTMSELDESLTGELAGLSGVDEVAPLIIGSVPGVGTIFGISLDDLDIVNIDVEPAEGRYPEEGQDEVVLGFNYAESSGLRVGDEIVSRGKKLDIVGILEYTGADEDNGVIGTFDIMQDLLGKKDKVSIIFVKPVDVSEAEPLAREIEGLFDVQAMSEKDAARNAAEFSGQLSYMTLFLGSIAAVIAGLGIMNVMFISVRERRKEIGTMKALGATTRTILAQIILEALLITLIGEAIGLTLSIGAVEALNTLSARVSATITPMLIINVTIFSVVLGILSGFLPAREAAKLQPAVVLRYE